MEAPPSRPWCPFDMAPSIFEHFLLSGITICSSLILNVLCPRPRIRNVWFFWLSCHRIHSCFLPFHIYDSFSALIILNITASFILSPVYVISLPSLLPFLLLADVLLTSPCLPTPPHWVTFLAGLQASPNSDSDIPCWAPCPPPPCGCPSLLGSVRSHTISNALCWAAHSSFVYILFSPHLGSDFPHQAMLPFSPPCGLPPYSAWALIHTRPVLYEDNFPTQLRLSFPMLGCPPVWMGLPWVLIPPVMPWGSLPHTLRFWFSLPDPTVYLPCRQDPHHLIWALAPQTKSSLVTVSYLIIL